MRKIPLQILCFNSSSLENLNQLENTGIAFQNIIKQNTSTIITCGSFSFSYKQLIDLAYKSDSLPRKQIEHLLQNIIDHHVRTLKELTLKEDDLLFSSLEKIQIIASKILALLYGISFIKEISDRTITLLDTYGSELAAILIQANIYYTSDVKVKKVDFEEAKRKRNSKLSHFIIPLPSKHHSKDHFVTDLGIAQKARIIHIWSQEGGVMSANPRIVPSAFPIQALDYATASEIGYLGGKILHPTAIQQLKEKKIPILLYSIDAPTTVASTITEITKDNQQPQVFTITERDKVSILTIKSTKMFDTHGYLENIFEVFSSFGIPVETLGTSEISVTLTFPTKNSSNEFLKEISKFGEIESISYQSIASIIGSGFGSNTDILGKIFSSIQGHTIHMISMGLSGSSLNLVFDTKYKREIIPKIYEVLLENIDND